MVFGRVKRLGSMHGQAMSRAGEKKDGMFQRPFWCQVIFFFFLRNEKRQTQNLLNAYMKLIRSTSSPWGHPECSLR